MKNCEFFVRSLKRRGQDVVLMPMCSYGSYHNEMFDINETDVPLFERASPYCPFTDCPHVAEEIVIDEKELIALYCDE